MFSIIFHVSELSEVFPKQNVFRVKTIMFTGKHTEKNFVLQFLSGINLAAIAGNGEKNKRCWPWELWS
jgi:hypothetical protein